VNADPFFSSRTGRGVAIAVVDSGVHAAHPHVERVAGGVALEPDGREGDDYVDRLGHGTAVAAAIREKAPDAALYAVKVFHDALATGVSRLVQAIDWAAARRIRLVNLSLGTANPAHKSLLGEAVRRAHDAGVIVVAARELEGVRRFPGSLPGVLPVLLDFDCPRNEYRIGAASDGSPVFRASGYPRPVPGVAPQNNLKGISFAVANMTAFSARALEAEPDADLARLTELLAAAALR
jgi:subtilisin family serine protease